MVTTIQISENIKLALDRMKLKKDTYEDVIINLITDSEISKRKNEQLLIEGCKVMAKENLKIAKELCKINDDNFEPW